MKYDQYDIFESPDLRLFSNKYKSGGFTDLFKSGMELISPLELISLQLNFENKEDLDKLKDIYETRSCVAWILKNNTATASYSIYFLLLTDYKPRI